MTSSTVPTYRTTLRTWTENDDAVVVFHKPGCPYCERVFECLHASGLDDRVVKVDVTSDNQYPLYRESLEAVTRCATVPKVFENGVYVGDSEATCSKFQC